MPASSTKAKTHKTNVPRVIRILLLLALPLAVYSSGSAAALQGKVADVVDGESIAVVSQNHPLKVKLIGVAAPDPNQAYAAIARQHLADLVLNKNVIVRFTSMRDGCLVGQVLLDQMDVGAQMIRDGVGWYNKSEGSNLSELERQVYQGSEDAARSERRGLWQDESPQAPWDFRKAQSVTAKIESRVRVGPTGAGDEKDPGRSFKRRLDGRHDSTRFDRRQA